MTLTARIFDINKKQISIHLAKPSTYTNHNENMFPCISPTSQARVFYLRSGSGEDPGSLWSREPTRF
jgi:hypothetical protein